MCTGGAAAGGAVVRKHQERSGNQLCIAVAEQVAKNLETLDVKSLARATFSNTKNRGFKELNLRTSSKQIFIIDKLSFLLLYKQCYLFYRMYFLTDEGLSDFKGMHLPRKKKYAETG